MKKNKNNLSSSLTVVHEELKEIYKLYTTASASL